jgi:hypothetical protein
MVGGKMKKSYVDVLRKGTTLKMGIAKMNTCWLHLEQALILGTPQF